MEIKRPERGPVSSSKFKNSVSQILVRICDADINYSGKQR